MGLFNGTCPLSNAEIEAANNEIPIFGHITTQKLLFYISCVFSGICVVSAGTLAIRHLFCFVKPREQRQIVRLAFYPVIFSVLSSLSIYSYPDSLYLEPARDAYEPIALVSLFLLFLEFAESNPANRDFYFSELENRKIKGSLWKKGAKYEVIPGGSLRWYQSKWVGLICYFITFILIKIVELILQAAGRYCATSMSPAFGHVWVLIISSIALPVGFLAVLTFFLRMISEPHFAKRGAKVKLLSFKAVIALNFVQGIVFELIIAFNLFKGTSKVTKTDVQIGIDCLFMTFEQAICAIWFQWSFSTREYHEMIRQNGEQKYNIFHAIAASLDPRDLFYGSVYGMRLLFKGVGPWGNGSWNKKAGGYGKIQEAAEGVYMRSKETISHQPSQQYDTLTTNQLTPRTSPTPAYSPPRGRPYKSEDFQAGAHLAPPPRAARSPSPVSQSGRRSSSPSSYELTPYDHAYGSYDVESRPLRAPSPNH